MIAGLEYNEPGVATTHRSPPLPVGTWAIDAAHSGVLFAGRKLRRWTTAGRLHGVGVIHLDELPPVGVVRFQQPSGLPVLTMTLDPANLETGAIDLDAMGSGPDHSGPRWWTLRSESLEILPTGTWRVMATLTAPGTSGLVELHFEVDPKASRPDRLVLHGRGVLDRQAFGMGKRTWIFGPEIQLELAVHATRVTTPTSTESYEEDLHQQHAALRQLLAARRRGRRAGRLRHRGPAGGAAVPRRWDA
jgi:polyisoprenoid-binding protein YceI